MAIGIATLRLDCVLVKITNIFYEPLIRNIIACDYNLPCPLLEQIMGSLVTYAYLWNELTLSFIPVLSIIEISPSSYRKSEEQVLLHQVHAVA